MATFWRQEILVSMTFRAQVFTSVFKLITRCHVQTPV